MGGAGRDTHGRGGWVGRGVTSTISGEIPGFRGSQACAGRVSDMGKPESYAPPEQGWRIWCFGASELFTMFFTRYFTRFLQCFYKVWYADPGQLTCWHCGNIEKRKVSWNLVKWMRWPGSSDHVTMFPQGFYKVFTRFFYKVQIREPWPGVSMVIRPSKDQVSWT